MAAPPDLAHSRLSYPVTHSAGKLLLALTLSSWSSHIKCDAKQHAVNPTTMHQD